VTGNLKNFAKFLGTKQPPRLYPYRCRLGCRRAQQAASSMAPAANNAGTTSPASTSPSSFNHARIIRTLFLQFCFHETCRDRRRRGCASRTLGTSRSLGSWPGYLDFPGPVVRPCALHLPFFRVTKGKDVSACDAATQDEQKATATTNLPCTGGA
jgi:hypothetical protein